MKNLLIFASVLLVSVVFFGCEKETMTPTSDSQKYISFDTWEDFMSTLEKLTTDEAFLHDWQRNQSITTLQTFEEQMDADFEKVTDEVSFNVFSKKYDGYFTFEDRTVRSTYKLGYIKHLLNEKGIVKIGNMIQQFLPDDRVITIGDGDETKLEVAKKMTKSDEANHIFISQINRSFSPDKFYHEHECNNNDGEWKIESQMILTDWATPIYSNYVFTGVFNIGWHLTVESASFNKNIFGNWYKKKSDLSVNGVYTIVVDGVGTSYSISKTEFNSKTLMHGRLEDLGTLDITNPNSVPPAYRIPTYDIDFFLKTGGPTNPKTKTFCNVEDK
jgi:hypothetical protein